MCSIESELHVQNLLSILGSMVNIIEGRPIIYDHLMSMRIFTLIVKMVIIRAPKITWQMNRGTNWIFYSTHTNCIFHILWQVGAERKIHLMSSNPSAKNRSPGAQHWFQAKFTNGLKCQIPLERKFCHGSLFSEIWFSTPLTPLAWSSTMLCKRQGGLTVCAIFETSCRLQRSQHDLRASSPTSCSLPCFVGGLYPRHQKCVPRWKERVGNGC